MTISTSVGRRRRCARAALLLSTILSVPALADPLASPPTYRENLTGPGGVNIITGALTVSSTDITAGTADDPAKLVLTRSYNSQSGGDTPFASMGAFFSHSLIADLSWGYCGQQYDPTGCGISINIMGRNYRFGTANGNYYSVLKDGATLALVSSSPYTFRLRTKDGTAAIFEISAGYSSGVYNNHDSFVEYVEFANGSFWSFAYESAGTLSTINNQPLNINRLVSVTNSRGYGLAFSYLNPSVGGSAARQQRLVSQVSAFKIVCGDTCDRQTTSSVSYDYSGNTHGAHDEYGQPVLDLSLVTLPDGTQKHLHHDGGPWGGYLLGISTNSNAYNDASYDYELIPVQESYENDPSYIGPYVTRVTDGNNKSTIFRYDYDTRSMTVTTPLNENTVYHSAFNPRTTAGVGNEPLPDIVTDPNGKVTHYGYDTYGRLLSVTYPEGNSVAQTLDDRENVTQTVKAPKPSVGGTPIVSSAHFVDCDDYNYRICNKADSVTDANGNVSDFQYDNVSGELATTLAPADATGKRAIIRYGWGAFNPAPGVSVPPAITMPEVSLTTVKDECRTSSVNGVSAITYVCPAANRIRTKYNYETSTTSSPSSHQLLSVVRDQDGIAATTSYTYDAAGNKLTEDGPLPGSADTTRYRYDAVRRVVGVVHPDPDGAGSLPGPAVRTTYDAYGQPTLVETGSVTDQSDGAWSNFTSDSQVATTYDQIERKSLEQATAGGTTYSLTQYSYDDDGRQLCSAVRMDPDTFDDLASGALTVDACALGSPGTNGPDRITKNVYDPAGQLVQVRKAVGTPIEQAYVTYGYTDNGKQRDVVDANGNRAQMSYDGFDREASWAFPSTTGPSAFDPSTPANAIATAGAVNAGDYESYGYDANDNRTSWRKRDGRMFGFSYDGLNRMLVKTVPTSCVSGYACTNAPSWATRSVYYGYDLQGHQTSATFDSAGGSDGVLSSYDDLGRLTASTTAMNGASRQMTFGYDADSNRTQVTFPDGQTFTYAYDTLNRESSIQQPGGATAVSFAYDAKDRLIGLGRANGAGTGWSYDGIGRLQSIGQDLAGTGSDVAYGFGYNPASQMVSLSTSNDAYAWSGASNASKGYSVNGLNQYTSVAGAGYGYDANGNLTSDGSTSYVYDAENRLVTASNGTTLTYDPSGRLWQTTGGVSGTTQFLYDGDQLSAEYDGSGNLLRRYVHGTGEDDPLVWYEGAGLATPRYYHADHQGSIVALSDANGNSVAVNSYDEYGVSANSNLGRFQYTGQAWLPDLRLYHYKARVYSPKLGRMLQTDPVGYKDQVNLYAYVANDPVNHADPSGMDGADDPRWAQATATARDTGALSCNGSCEPVNQGRPERSVPGGRITDQEAKCRSCHGVDTTSDARYTTDKENEKVEDIATTLISVAIPALKGSPTLIRMAESRFPQTGRAIPRNLNESLALEAARSRPQNGKPLPLIMGDKRFPAGSVKMSYRSPGGVEVHYVKLPSGNYVDFKFGK